MSSENNTVTRLVRATKRARHKTTLGQLETLQREQTRWLRRATFARNKLASIRASIEAIAVLAAQEKFDGELEDIS